MPIARTPAADLYAVGLRASYAINDDWFPARCKMIITPRHPKHTLAERGMLVTVEPAYPNTWRREPYYSQLLAWAQKIHVEIRIGRRCIRLHADASEEEFPQQGLVRGTG